MSIEQLSHAEFHDLIEGQTVLEHDRYGIKVVETADRKMIKLFRLKRWWSSARFYPYAERFRVNSEKLRALGIPCVCVERVAYCREEKRYLVIYPKIEGKSLRTILQGGYRPEYIARLAGLIGELHRQGVYFRSLHLGNIIATGDGDYALIDCADMRIRGRPLNLRRRMRNFRHLFRYREDLGYIQRYQLNRFLDDYGQASGVNGRQLDSIRESLHALLSKE